MITNEWVVTLRGSQDVFAGKYSQGLGASIDKSSVLIYNYYHMVSISGIEDQKTLEKMPYLNKAQLQLLIGKEGKNLDKKLICMFLMRFMKKPPRVCMWNI